MPLPKPVLDARTFDQLVAEARGQIPRLAAAWTDYNLSDPGITLFELFAWLAEQSFYRFDRVSSEMMRGFMRLVGTEPRPPGVARVVVLLDTSSVSPVPLPDATQVSASIGTPVCETTRPLTVTPAKLARVLAGRSPQVDVTQANLQASGGSDELAGTFEPFGPAPRPGDALTLGFDAPLGVPGDEISLHVWTLTPERDRDVRAALIEEWNAAQAELQKDCPPLAPTLDGWQQHYSVRTVWEYHAGPSDWRPLETEDETRALTLTGFVRFRVPNGHVPGEPDPLYAIRCRMAGGQYDCVPRLDRVAVNAGEAEHAETLAADELLGTSRGHARDRYTTGRGPVVPGSTALVLTYGAQSDATWRGAATWDEVGPHDRTYVMDYAEGALRTGDGLRGAVPPAGWALNLAYRVGGGESGNIAAATLDTIPASDRNVARVPNWPALGPTLGVSQPYRARGGAEAESPEQTQARALASLAGSRKAVTLDDYAALTRSVPGVPVGRAWASAEHFPLLPCVRAPGHVTVVVVPDCPGPRPLASPDLLRAVERHLDRRRLVTTDVHAVAARYVEVGVRATLHLEGGTARAAADAADRAIAAFFDPLTGGPQQTGWPAGRGVYRSEVMAILAALPGVACVSELAFQIGDEPSARCGNVAICPGDLVAPGPHHWNVRAVPVTRAFERSVEHECPRAAD
jgi:predicted phage baseplate assembly protein